MEREEAARKTCWFGASICWCVGAANSADFPGRAAAPRRRHHQTSCVEDKFLGEEEPGPSVEERRELFLQTRRPFGQTPTAISPDSDRGRDRRPSLSSHASVTPRPLDLNVRGVETGREPPSSETLVEIKLDAASHRRTKEDAPPPCSRRVLWTRKSSKRRRQESGSSSQFGS